MSTTLEDEMEESAKLYDADAARALAANDGASIAYAAARASHFRQRAAWVRELGPMEFTSRSDAALWRRLTGPIPSPGTATTEGK